MNNNNCAGKGANNSYHQVALRSLWFYYQWFIQHKYITKVTLWAVKGKNRQLGKCWQFYLYIYIKVEITHTFNCKKTVELYLSPKTYIVPRRKYSMLVTKFCFWYGQQKHFIYFCCKNWPLIFPMVKICICGSKYALWVFATVANTYSHCEYLLQ